MGILSRRLHQLLLNIAARDKIKSISLFAPENANELKCFVISLVQETNGITVTSCFSSRLSEPHIPPTIVLNEQQTSISQLLYSF